MRSSKPLYITWFAAIAVVIIISVKYRKGETTELYGIAETREIIVNSSRAVEVEKIFVVPGQTVKKGDPLAELISAELTKEINVTFHKLRELKAQFALNKEVTSELKSLQGYSAYEKTIPDSPLHIETNNEPQVHEKNVKLLENPIEIQIQRLEKELELLNEERNKLSVFAQVSGKIGSVFCKAGQQISPYDTILTLHTTSPGYVKGFIHEDMYTKVFVGQKVKIAPAANSVYHITGEVVGIGSKIIEYPRRLRTPLAARIYGKEIQIKIPETNHLLLGEKVIISIPFEKEEDTQNVVEEYLFSERTKTGINRQDYAHDRSHPSAITATKIGTSLTNGVNIEASGLLYLKEIKKYILVSDTTRDNQAIFSVMDTNGNISKEIYLHDVKRIDDMEAITADNEGNIFVVCSQSCNTDGTLPEERKLLLRIKWDGSSFTLDKKVYLYDLLRGAAEKNKNVRWAQFITSGSNTLTINIEGMFYSDGTLHFGLKWPLKDGKAVILRIHNIHEVFDKGLLEGENIELWREFALQNTSNLLPKGISDLYLYRNKLYILSYGKIKVNSKRKMEGDLWVYDMLEGPLTHVKHFENLKPEGIAFNPDDNVFLITFDHGRNHPSKIMELEVTSL